MHDTAKLLGRGLPAVCICTEPFASAARAHARTLSWAGYEPVAIPHPLQTLTASAVEKRADGIVEEIVQRFGVRRHG
jgi:hypothetical protein